MPGSDTNKTTGLVATYRNGSDAAYSYTYDDNGNITSITQGSTSITYEYDAANRLTRENNGVTNQTIVYDYTNDLWGNIQSKTVYPYTTGTLGTPTSTVNYAYTNSAWGDQLTEYDGQTITYDSMGNPTTYRGYTMTWRGKQLAGFTGGTKNIAFEYNEDGLRQKKTYNGVVTDYYYNGSVLIGMQRGTSKFLFSYDASGNVVSVKYITANDTNEYYYLRNAQNDVVKLIDANGVIVVEYTYDTWGKKVTTTGSLAGTLGLIQPFRYRGYVYDYETGFYYLQSRYYDPTTGRFISADVLLSTGQGVLGHNCYAYCLGNPVNMADDGGSAARDVALVSEKGGGGWLPAPTGEYNSDEDEDPSYPYIDDQNNNRYTNYKFGWWGNLKRNGCLIYAIYNVVCEKGYSFDSVYDTVMGMNPAVLCVGLLGGAPSGMERYIKPYGTAKELSIYDNFSEYDAVIILMGYYNTKVYVAGAFSCRSTCFNMLSGAHYYAGVANGNGLFTFHNGPREKMRINSVPNEILSLAPNEGLMRIWGINLN